LSDSLASPSLGSLGLVRNFDYVSIAGEIQEKIALYLEAGAQEVWVCELDGRMTFYRTEGEMRTSVVCPSFPGKVPAFPVR
jgi:hypothetical protein